jgi:hypothetical protein
MAMTPIPFAFHSLINATLASYNAKQKLLLLMP